MEQDHRELELEDLPEDPSELVILCFTGTCTGAYPR
jgi:hypothetical protein